MDGEKNIMSKGKSPSGLAGSASSLLHGQSPRESLLTLWGGDERSKVGGRFSVCYHGAAKKSAVFLQKIAPQT